MERGLKSSEKNLSTVIVEAAVVNRFAVVPIGVADRLATARIHYRFHALRNEDKAGHNVHTVKLAILLGRVIHERHNTPAGL